MLPITCSRNLLLKSPVVDSTEAVPEVLPLGEARRRWAELLRRLYGVDPLACPACGGAMRLLAVITEGAVIDRILAHVRRARGDARRAPARSRWHAGSQRSPVRPYGDSNSYP